MKDCNYYFCTLSLLRSLKNVREFSSAEKRDMIWFWFWQKLRGLSRKWQLWKTQYYYEKREFSLKKTRANKVLSVNSKLSYTHQVLKLVTVIELSVRSLYLHSYSLLQLLNMAFRDSFWKSFVRESLFINVDSLLLTPTRRQLFSLSNS